MRASHAGALSESCNGLQSSAPRCKRHFTRSITRPERGTPVTRAAANDGSRGGLRMLEWTGKLVPQGFLVKGAKFGWRTIWRTFMQELAPQSKDGDYSRPSYDLRNAIGDADFPAEEGRYAVFVGNACPWCHRVLLALILRGLLPGISVVHMQDDPERASRGGWVFDTPDPIFGCNDLREVYELCQPGFRGRCTAPLLVDRKQKRLVSNESADIVRMLNTVQLPGASDVDLYPRQLAARIDEVNDLVYNQINNGVYKSGFATTQAAYDRAQAGLYAALEQVEGLLQRHRFLTGDRFTEADLRLYPTIIRFDSVYTNLFKCNRRRISDYPALHRWRRDVHNLAGPAGGLQLFCDEFSIPPCCTAGCTTSTTFDLEAPAGGLQVRDSFDLADAMRSYFQQLFPLNPSAIVPSGPTLADLGLEAAGREAAEGDAFHRQPAAARV